LFAKKFSLHKNKTHLVLSSSPPHTRQVSCRLLLIFIVHDERKPTCIQGGSFSKRRLNDVPQPRRRPMTCARRKPSMLRQLLPSRLTPESVRWRPPWKTGRLPKTLLKRSQSDRDRRLPVEEDLQIYPSNLMLKVRTIEQLGHSTAADTDNTTVDTYQGTGPPVVMEARQATQGTVKAKSVRPRQVPVSRGRPTNMPVQPCVEGEDNSIMSFDRRH